MGRDCAPWQGDLEACVEVASEGRADSLVSVHFDQPILGEFAEELILIEEQVELQLLHYLRRRNPD